MTRRRFAVLWLCVALGACGQKFTANGGSGDGGASSAGRAGDSATGEAGAGGSAGNEASAGTGDDASAGDTGSDAGGGGRGGAPTTGGTGGLLGIAGGLPLDPTLPQSGLLVWLRADRGVQQKDGIVQTWQDQSGNQIDATQLSANVRPTYLAAGFNGRPTIEFDGHGQFLTFAQAFGDFSKGLAGFIVAKPSKSDCASMLELSNGSEVDDVSMGMWQNRWLYEVEALYIQTGSVNLQGFSLYTVNHRPSAAEAILRINGSELSSLGMPVPVVPESESRRNNFIGHTLYMNDCEYFKGQISEIILYSRFLKDDELSQIETYLTSHWALGDQDTPAP